MEIRSVVKVPASIARGEYQEWIVNNGHMPTVLSGAELQGKARLYGGRYAASRDAVIGRIAEYNVTDDVVLMRVRDNGPMRWCRVWVDMHTRSRVRVETSDS